jgi:hypothetical protein
MGRIRRVMDNAFVPIVGNITIKIIPAARPDNLEQTLISSSLCKSNNKSPAAGILPRQPGWLVTVVTLPCRKLRGYGFRAL